MDCPDEEGSLCKTCIQYKHDENPEPATIPKIEAKLLKEPCGKAECGRLLNLPECQNKSGHCKTRISFYACGHVKRENSHTCKGCRATKDVEDFHFVPTTRPKLYYRSESLESRPKWKGVCDDCKQKQRRWQEAEETQERRARYANRNMRQQGADYSQEPQGRQTQYFGHPEPQYADISNAGHRRQQTVPVYEPALRPNIIYVPSDPRQGTDGTSTKDIVSYSRSIRKPSGISRNGSESRYSGAYV